jgi:preprotein translocase subunit SecF
MANRSPNNKRLQKGEAGRDLVQVGENYTNTTTHTSNTTLNLWVSFFLIGVLALGGLAWALNVGLIKGSGNPQQTDQPSSTPAAKP